MKMTKRVFRGISGMILMLVAGVGTVLNPETTAAQCTADIIVNQNPTTCFAQVVIEANASSPAQSYTYLLDGNVISNGQTFMVLNLPPGTYSAGVVVITDQGCTAVDDTVFTVAGTVTTVDAGPDTVGCQQNTQLSVDVTSGHPYSIQWTPAYLLDDATSATPTIIETVTNQWFIVDVVDDVNGCVTSDTIHVTQQNPVIETVSLCDGPVQINLGSGANMYDWLSWTDTSGTSHPLNYPTTQHLITVNEPGEYFAVAYFQECGALTSLVTVEACQQPCWNAFTQNIFPNQCGDLYEFVSTGTGQLTSWSWDFGDGTTSSVPHPNHVFTSGTYEVTLTTINTDGCTATSSQTFTSNSGITLSMSNDTVGCQEEAYMEVFANGGSGNYSYQWFPQAGLSDPYSAITYATGVHNQNYLVEVTDNVSGCTVGGDVTVSSYVAHNETLYLCNDSVLIDLGPGADFYNLAPLSFDQQQQSVWTDDTGTYVVYAQFPGCGALTSVFEVEECQTPTCSSEFIHVINPQNCGALVDFAGTNFSSPVDSVLWNYGNGETHVDGGVGEAHYFAPGIYTVTTTVYHTNGCISSYSEVITVVQNFSVELVQDTVACNGVFQTDHTITGGSNNLIYSWSPAALMDDPQAVYPQVNVAFDTLVTVMVEDMQTGCLAFDSVYIYSNSPINTSLQLCSDSVLLEVDPGSLVYQWSFTDDFGNTTQLSSSGNAFLADEVGTYVCLSFHPNCNTITHTFVVQDCTSQNDDVWPGDANSDGVVTNADALYLGLAFNQTGPVRPAATLNWVGQACPDWNFNFSQNNVNLKHADCDGNGIVNFDDTLAIDFNYLNTHNKTEESQGGNPPIWVEATPDTVGLEQAIDIVVHLGTANQPVDSLHGVAFSLMFNEMLLTPNGLSIDFDNCSLGTAGVDVIGFRKNLFSDGMIDMAVTRNTLVNWQGYGPIGHARIVTTDNLSGITALVVNIGGVEALTASETEVELSTIADTVIIDPSKVGIEENDFENVLIYPNPTTGVVNVSGLSGKVSIVVTDALGRRVQEVPFNGTGRVLIDISSEPFGVYFLTIQSETAVVTRKVKLIK